MLTCLEMLVTLSTYLVMGNMCVGIRDIPILCMKLGDWRCIPRRNTYIERRPRASVSHDSCIIQAPGDRCNLVVYWRTALQSRRSNYATNRRSLVSPLCPRWPANVSSVPLDRRNLNLNSKMKGA